MGNKNTIEIQEQIATTYLKAELPKIPDTAYKTELEKQIMEAVNMIRHQPWEVAKFMGKMNKKS